MILSEQHSMIRALAVNLPKPSLLRRFLIRLKKPPFSLRRFWTKWRKSASSA